MPWDWAGAFGFYWSNLASQTFPKKPAPHSEEKTSGEDSLADQENPDSEGEPKEIHIVPPILF